MEKPRSKSWGFLGVVFAPGKIEAELFQIRPII